MMHNHSPRLCGLLVKDCSSELPASRGSPNAEWRVSSFFTEPAQMRIPEEGRQGLVQTTAAF